MNYVRWSRWLCGIAVGVFACRWFNYHVDLVAGYERGFLSLCVGSVAGILAWAQTFNLEWFLRFVFVFVGLLRGEGHGVR